jgi:hypothetical protein
MSEHETSDYALWVELANDPSQSEEGRRHHRLRMEGYLHNKVREAFKFAAGKQLSGVSTPLSPEIPAIVVTPENSND